MASLFADQNHYFKEKEFQSRHISPNNLIISRIFSTNIFPTKSLPTLSYERMCFLCAFLINDSIEPSHICAHMIKVFHSKSITNLLPYPYLIMKFLVANSIIIPREGTLLC